MAMRPEEIAALIQRGLPGAEVAIDDLRGDGEHYAARVAYAGFAGKTRVAQHQMVYAALGGAMAGPLHALAIHTRVPEEGT